MRSQLYGMFAVPVNVAVPWVTPNPEQPLKVSVPDTVGTTVDASPLIGRGGEKVTVAVSVWQLAPAAPAADAVATRGSIGRARTRTSRNQAARLYGRKRLIAGPQTALRVPLRQRPGH